MNEILYELLRKYRLNQLSLEEKTAFEQRLADDPAFAAEAAEYATLQSALQQEGDRLLNEQLTLYAQNLTAMKNSDASPKMTVYRRILYAAAAVLALALVALPLWLADHSGQTPDEIFAANFNVPPAPGVRDEAAPSWRAAYEKGDYQKTIADLKAQLADKAFRQRSEAHYYIGVSQLALSNPGEALKSLEQVSPDSYDREAAQWYSALALLKMGRTEEAKIVIDDIVHQTSHPYNARAKKVLEDLE